MLSVALESLVTLMTGNHLFYLFIGVFFGLVVGILPALGGLAGLSLLLPFIYGMEPLSALAMLVGLVAVAPTGDTFTSVLMGIPGSSASQATILDGFPMVKRGEGARALSAAFTASLLGGLFGAAVLTVFVLIARPVILAFSSAELFMLSIFGLSMVGSLSGQSMWKGIAGCAIGLLLGAVGTSPATGESRFIMGSDYLYDGIQVAIFGLGLFALPEIIDLLRRKQAIATTASLGGGWVEGVRDNFRNIGLVLRCSGIGSIIGIMPGIGGAVSDWIAYGHVIQTSKDKSQFGKGDVRGVIAPESANNSVQGGNLVPTLLFGIPGSGGMAIFLAGMALVGIQPGPTMVSTNLGLTYGLIWSLAIANVAGAGACLLLSPFVARIAEVRYTLVGPILILIVCFAAFNTTREWGDLFALFGVGIFAVFMKRFGWPRPPLLIGFVLAPSVETFLYQAIQFHGVDWLYRPGAVIIAVITVASMWFGLKYGRPTFDEGGASGQVINRRAPVLFSLALVALTGLALALAYRFSFLAGVFPMTAAGIGLVATVAVAWQTIRARPGAPVLFDTEADWRDSPELAASLPRYIYWLVGLIALTAIVGFVAAAAIWIFLFVVAEAKLKVTTGLVYAAVIVACLAALSEVLVLTFPGGLLQELVELPWPFS